MNLIRFGLKLLELSMVVGWELSRLLNMLLMCPVFGGVDVVINLPISAYACESGWRWDTISTLLPPDICDLISAVKPPSPSGEDVPI